MSAVLHLFPVSPAYAAQREADARREAFVIAARAVIRSAANHSDATLTDACEALRTWGDWIDHLEADAMLLAMRLRASRKARDAASTAKPAWTIAAWAGEVCAWRVFVGFAVAVAVVGGAL